MEAELVGLDDLMPQVIWTRYFFEAQGYTVKDNIIYQDNESAIWLEKNGKGSSSKRTRHIDICYFFVTDRIAADDLTIEYCHTGMMIGNFFTKALQSKAFCTFRDMVMNIKTTLPREVPLIVQTDSSFSDDVSGKTQPTSSGISPQECVGKIKQNKTEVAKTDNCI
eukprot:1208046-Ditylum_brightwellii.AAC.1